MLTVLAGLGLGLSLIVAIGAQNVFVLRQGIRREHVLAVVLICALSDAALIAAGVAGLGFVLSAAPWLVVVARWAGALFLLTYGILAARRAWRGGEELDADGTNAALPGPPAADGSTTTLTGTRLAPVILTTLALTWLNPHVYLDTVLMLGSIAATHGDERWLFAAGAIAASLLWFTALGFGARYLGRWLRTPRSWRILDAVIAVIMISIAISLVLPVLGG
ncbi:MULTISPECIES: L-lysine exporter [unclassified Microbacterium]|uniref:L-lysine exporter n=1 Tax=unclassified Microbacterium TaxID=2609290 RepID=UPI000CFC612A|nr:MULTISPECIES: L-lysine exporter [unclassified Microbacterium]PQZ52455.1 amino acid transporter [Microbacterium sp. MYb43]PQZ73041.1 amino acid transporter [Microbacterium sp. MYb40]PRB21888.1 amino acid transporter [Microbacterium sp. MYb54]PRB31648.1 amino acid transporter [Microbacterium sp. MYb50]PRB61783.1 amino acid transporter [Microbacterium sp. MYb24]